MQYENTAQQMQEAKRYTRNILDKAGKYFDFVEIKSQQYNNVHISIFEFEYLNTLYYTGLT